MIQSLKFFGSPFMLHCLVIVGALLGALAFSYDVLWWLIFLSPTPLLVSIYNEGVLNKRLFFLCLLWGTIFFGGVLWWLWHTLPLNWLGVTDPALQRIAILLYWGTISLFLGIFPALWGLSARFLFTKTPFDILLFPSLWILFEYARSWAFSLFAYGEGTIVGGHWSVGVLGYALAEHAFLRSFASLGGVYLLSFIVVGVTSTVSWILLRGHGALRGKVVLLGGLVAFVALSTFFAPFSVGIKQNHEHSLRVAVMQTNFPPGFQGKIGETRNFLALESLVAQIRKAGENPDIIIFPEDSLFLQSLLPKEGAGYFFNTILGEKERLIIDSGSVRDTSSSMHLRMYYFNTKTGDMPTQDKQLLVPQGEYRPFFYQIIEKAAGKSALFDRLAERHSYARGFSMETGEVAGVRVGGLFCSDVMSPILYREMAQKSPGVFVNVASHSWFHNSKLMEKQSKNMGSIRAAEHGRPFIRSGNGTISLVLNENGAVIAETASVGNAVLFATTTPTTGATPYTRFGDLILFMALVISISGKLFFYFKKRPAPAL
ncbi:MAG: apolipoprotein N-acyltransferase [Parcubacteria group bacterium]|nr:apolipoprotein N-acyltransferase [Parcubacteria group bacterium]